MQTAKMTISVAVTPDFHAAVTAAAARLNMSVSGYVRYILIKTAAAAGLESEICGTSGSQRHPSGVPGSPAGNPLDPQAPPS
jgi:hypothetical protein